MRAVIAASLLRSCVTVHASHVGLWCSAGANGGALVISGNGYTLTNISNSAFASNTAAQTEASPSSEGAADGGDPCLHHGILIACVRYENLVCHVLLCNCSGFVVAPSSSALQGVVFVKGQF